MSATHAELDTLNAEALLDKYVSNHGSYTMTQEEATFVWSRYHELIEGNRELELLALLVDHLSGESAKGERCAVCGRFQDARCIEDC